MYSISSGLLAHTYLGPELVMFRSLARLKVAARTLLAVGGPSTVTRFVLRLSKEVRQSPAVRPLFC